MAYPIVSFADYYTPENGQLKDFPELQNYQPHQSFEKSHDESHLEKA